ncbi:hypothetical protein GPECTOR_7g913 [Gonium pectorale]|uniref:UBA domain-containing protein n=1 Tax=Gonium pectorale TaxID=33097 RepID=A0A150GUN4_GONPE|nr:hypothetical protein GPECTOR_7g913 [Gonium pectorale]|eukprot:KXZ53463.1 hypothetical protein GPECTOR_7g913 [Gonium pectorale]
MGGDAVVKLIVGGRTLQDDTRTLREAGVNAASRVLVTRGAASGDAGAATGAAAAERARRLERVRKAAEALAGRDSRGLSDDIALDVEDQAGTAVAIKPEDRRNLVFGLVLHDKAKATMRRGDYASALEELLLAEEALGLCDPALTSSIDNVPLLLLDLVWAAYKLGDTRRLAVSRERLVKARAGLERAHGPQLERLRTLTGGGAGFSPELATYLRLEVLEGLVAFYGGGPEGRAAAEGNFRAAQAKWRRLQVSDEALAMLQSMGYGLKESRRGLRFSGGDVSAALDFIQKQREADEERNARRRKVADWNHERVHYGKTAGGQYVDPEQLDKLEGLGFPRRLAAEALRKHENRGQDALDELSKPDRRRALELALALQEGLKGTSRAAGGNGGAAGSSSAAPAVAAPSTAATAPAAGGSAADGGDAAAPAANAAALAALKAVAEAMMAATKQAAGSAAAPNAAGTEAGTVASALGAASGAAGAAPMETETQGEGAPGQSSAAEEEDGEKAEVKEAERELVRNVESDPMAAYDIDVSEEGDIIATFLTMLSTGAAAAAGRSTGS